MRNTRISATRRAGLTATAVVAALVLTACGGDSDDKGSSSASASSSSTAGSHNAQDVSFAQDMIPHHRQAVEMARLAPSRASSAKVKDLAARIEKAQDPEITTMSGWLRSWGEKVPSSTSGMDHSDGSDMSDMSGMSGMMSDDDMAELKKMSGKDFDTMFLTMMVEHHEGAVTMARTEKAKGSYGPAVSLSDDIITGQTAEITEMNKLLGKS